MEIITGTTQFEIKDETAVAIGKFDGIHVGHRRLLEEILNAKDRGLKACVFTFDPAPSVLFSGTETEELTTREEKRILFDRMGIDILVEFPMTLQNAAIPPERFVRNILKGCLNASFVVAGTDVTFGDKGAGNRFLLEKMAEENDYTVKIIDKVSYEDRVISSTLVRETVEEGDMKLAEKLLGVSYSFFGTVVHGKGQGKRWGFPTANLVPEPFKLLPPPGVYFSEIFIDGEKYAGITNVGWKPTVQGTGAAGVESYIYEFDRNIYDQEIEVRLLEFKRPEIRFASVTELRKQVNRDMEEGKSYHKL